MAKVMMTEDQLKGLLSDIPELEVGKRLRDIAGIGPGHSIYVKENGKKIWLCALCPENQKKVFIDIYGALTQYEGSFANIKSKVRKKIEE